MEHLVGKRIAQLWVNADESELLFIHPDGSMTAYQTWGDCCSETWFADITGYAALINATVITAEDVEMADIDDERSRQEHDSCYGVKLTTDKGYVDIVYRNSSNGYYGGDIGPLPVGPDFDASRFRQITDDWLA